jgi:hypothetical protein
VSVISDFQEKLVLPLKRLNNLYLKPTQVGW